MSKPKSIAGTVTLEDGTVIEFTINSEGYSQWGQPTAALSDNVDLLSALEDAARPLLANFYGD